MSIWLAPRPGGTYARAARPGGTAWRAPRPGGTHWILPSAAQPPLPGSRELADALFTADGTLSVLVVPLHRGDAAFTSEGTLSVLVVPHHQADAAFAAEGTLSVLVEVVGQIVEQNAPFMSEATLSVASLQRHSQSAPFTSEATLSVVSLPRFARTGDLSGEGALSVVSLPRFARVADFSAEGTLSAMVFVVPQRAADFSGAGALSVVSFPRFINTAPLSGVGTLSVVAIQKTDWTDDFNRSNGALGSNWATFALGTDTTVVPEINTNALRAKSTTTNNQANQCFAVATAAAAQCLTDTMATRATMLAGENGLFFGPIVRASSDGANLVFAVISSDSAATGIYTRIAGTFTRRTTTATTAFAANDVFELQASGNVYTLKSNPDGANTTIDTWTDSSNLYTPGATKRYGGIYHHSDRNAFSTQNWAPAVDNFRVRDL